MTFWDDEPREYRGVVLYFIERMSYGSFAMATDTTPHYVYMPMDIPLEKDAVDAWIQETRLQMRREWTLFETLYWYLDDYSCVLVERNRMWFCAARSYIEKIWNIIVQERETGCEHRASKKRTKPTEPLSITQLNKENNGSTITSNDNIITTWVNKKSVCLVKLDADDL